MSLPTYDQVMKWDHHKLLEWLQSQEPITLQEDSEALGAFKASEVQGSVFLEEGTAFFRSCGVPLGVARRMELLGKQFRDNHKKRKLEFDEEPQVKRYLPEARKQYTELRDQVSRISTNLDDYCDPSICQMLPFMFVGAVPGDRFFLDKNGRFEYYGREKFRDLYEAVKSMRFQGTRKYFLHGTHGAGKSYILAALTCLLFMEGVKVVYLPDCREMLCDSFHYLQSALRLTFTGAGQHYEQSLASTECARDLVNFCTARSSESIRLLFVIDQVNALDPRDEESDRFPLDIKRSTRTLLDTTTSSHMKLSSSSGNYLHALHDTHRQTGEKRLTLYGGLTEGEMHKWWGKHENMMPMQFCEEDKAEIQDLLGNIPILLNVLLNLQQENRNATHMQPQEKEETYESKLNQLHGQLRSCPEVSAMVSRILSFAVEQSDTLHDTPKLLRYREAFSSCITGGSVSPAAELLLDWRYFYVSNGTGKCNCGFARQVGARFLREVMNATHFLTPNWYESLRLAGSNPSMLGFFTEQMLLSYISVTGCPSAGPEFGGQLKSVFFQTKTPVVSSDMNGSFLYIPTSFNFEGVDAILVSVNQGKKEAVIVGLQITISKTHSDSEGKFFQDWQRWEDIFRGLKITFRFLWILEKIDGKILEEDVEGINRSLKSGSRQLRPPFRRAYTSVMGISKDIGTKLEIARDA